MIIFDLDGTLRDLTHRLHHISFKPRQDWDAFYKDCGKDKPIQHMIDTLHDLASHGENTMIWSGCSDIARRTTLDWLYIHGDIAVEDEGAYHEYNDAQTVIKGLWMRTHGDFTGDEKLKRSWLHSYQTHNLDDPVTLVFDDRARVVDMWRDEGIRCVQVAPGEF